MEYIRKTHQWVDALVGQIVISGGIALDQLAVLGVVTLSDLVDLEAENAIRLAPEHVLVTVTSHGTVKVFVHLPSC